MAAENPQNAIELLAGFGNGTHARQQASQATRQITTTPDSKSLAMAEGGGLTHSERLMAEINKPNGEKIPVYLLN
ncbi:MAG: hypothetical protein IT567_05220 [Alphaproteobacteria bacterium]|nr:hypothetical protein [Alphaproteobacteria bacterium]